jgi:hypothetical protein
VNIRDPGFETQYMERTTAWDGRESRRLLLHKIEPLFYHATGMGSRILDSEDIDYPLEAGYWVLGTAVATTTPKLL